MTTLFLALLLGRLAPAADPAPARNNRLAEATTVVVCPVELQSALTQWWQHRSRQGHRLALLSLDRSTPVAPMERANRIRRSIQLLARRGQLKSIVLVGDAPPSDDALHRSLDQEHGSFDATANRQRNAMLERSLRTERPQRATIPTFHLPAKINVEWGSETQIASDQPYADVDDDGTPDLAIGRLPAQSADELSVMLANALASEQASIADWQRRIGLVAGVGGFGVLADTVVESAARAFIRKGIPPAYRTHIAYASWRSPYCPDPRLFRSEVIRQYNQGCLLWVYIGHGLRDELDWIHVPIGRAPIFTARDVSRLSTSSGSPIAVFLSCYGAAFDGVSDGLAERMLKHRGGPSAVIGGTRVTMPYGMALLSQAMMDQMFQVRPATLGEVLLGAKRAVMSDDVDDRHPVLNAVARLVSPNPDDLVGERREHALMFHLLGDPLLPIPRPKGVDIAVTKSIAAGDRVQITCRSEVAGRCLVELTCPRGKFTFEPKVRVAFDGTDQGMRQLTDVYRKANDDTYTAKRLTRQSAEFTTSLEVPDGAAGACLIRVFVQGASEIALGATTVYVDSPPSEAARVAERNRPDPR